MPMYADCCRNWEGNLEDVPSVTEVPFMACPPWGGTVEQWVPEEIGIIVQGRGFGITGFAGRCHGGTTPATSIVKPADPSGVGEPMPWKRMVHPHFSVSIDRYTGRKRRATLTGQ